jgi:hypothetical protein
LKQEAAVVMPSGQSPFERLGMQFGSLHLSSQLESAQRVPETKLAHAAER